MESIDLISNWEGTLEQIQQALKAAPFGKCVNGALDLLEVSLEILCEKECLSKVSVETICGLEGGGTIINRYALGKKEADDDELEYVRFIKKSVLKENE